MTEKYDDKSWHEEDEDFPNGLPPDSAGSHIAYFLAWAVRRNLVSEDLKRDFSREVARIVGGEFASIPLMKAIDGKVTSEDLNEQGRSVAERLYDTYVARWGAWCEDHGFESLYHAPADPKHEEAAIAILEGLLEAEG